MQFGVYSKENFLLSHFPHSFESLEFRKIYQTEKLADSEENHYRYGKVERFCAFLSGLPTLAANVDFLLHPTKASVSKQQH